MAATSLELEIVARGKGIIETGDVHEFAEFAQELLDTEFFTPPSWPYVLQKVYLHACLKRKPEIAKFLEDTVKALPRLYYQGVLL